MHLMCFVFILLYSLLSLLPILTISHFLSLWQLFSSSKAFWMMFDTRKGPALLLGSDGDSRQHLSLSSSVLFFIYTYTGRGLQEDHPLSLWAVEMVHAGRKKLVTRYMETYIYSIGDQPDSFIAARYYGR